MDEDQYEDELPSATPWWRIAVWLVWGSLVASIIYLVDRDGRGAGILIGTIGCALLCGVGMMLMTPRDQSERLSTCICDPFGIKRLA